MISEALPLLLLEDAVNEVRVPVKMIARSLRIVKRIHLRIAPLISIDFWIDNGK